MKFSLFRFILVLNFFLLLSDYLGLLAVLKSPVDSLIVPVKKTVRTFSVNIASFSLVLGQFSEFRAKFEELEKLKKEVNELNLKLSLLSEENKTLRNQLQAPLPASYSFIPAPVLSVSRFLEIGVGLESGVSKNMIVVDGVTLIGKVIDVSGKRSSVLLSSDPDSSIPAKTEKGTKGVVVGQSGENVFLEKVLQKEPLFLNETVLTSGEGGYPANLVIGRISYIKSDEISPYKSAKIEMPIKIAREKLVFVISSL